jgi:hypothetical protein
MYHLYRQYNECTCNFLMEKTETEKIVAKEKKCVNVYVKNVYVLIQYNNDDNYDADVVNVYNNPATAKEALIERIHRDFINCDGEYDTESSDLDEDSENSEEGSSNSTNPKDIIKGLHDRFPNALSAPKKHDHRTDLIPGFDKKNWDHVKPLIIKELDEYRKGYWEYNNEFGYLNYKVCKKTVHLQ